MKRKVILLLTILISLSVSGATYYISPNGKDSNNGDISHPFATLNKAGQLLEQVIRFICEEVLIHLILSNILPIRMGLQ